jgi:hypothetical protein
MGGLRGSLFMVGSSLSTEGRCGCVGGCCGPWYPWAVVVRGWAVAVVRAWGRCLSMRAWGVILVRGRRIVVRGRSSRVEGGRCRGVVVCV